MTITHITPKEQALMRENERLTDQVKRQSQTIHVQAVAIQSMTEEIEGLRAALKAQPVKQASDDEVICPQCCNQFRAIPVSVQQLLLDAGFEPPFKGAKP